MNWDRIEGNWKQTKGMIKERWGRLTNDHIDMIDGRRVKQLGEIQESYGIARDDAKHQARNWKKGKNKPKVVKDTLDIQRIARENAWLIGR